MTPQASTWRRLAERYGWEVGNVLLAYRDGLVRTELEDRFVDHAVAAAHFANLVIEAERATAERGGGALVLYVIPGRIDGRPEAPASDVGATSVPSGQPSGADPVSR